MDLCINSQTLIIILFVIIAFIFVLWPQIKKSVIKYIVNEYIKSYKPAWLS